MRLFRSRLIPILSIQISSRLSITKIKRMIRTTFTTGLALASRKWQADQVAKHIDAEEGKAFKADEGKGHVQPKKYGSVKVEGDAPVRDL